VGGASGGARKLSEEGEEGGPNFFFKKIKLKKIN
jgi:hypothetical protein